MPDDSRLREWRTAACPHDCPSTCALEVERLDAHRIGKVRGAAANSYTAGVICAKVSRYAERVHHPLRLTRPLKRVGEKGQGRDAFVEIGWDEALDITADAMKRAAAKDGTEAVWPYYYAGTMGLVQRDGIERLRHTMRYSRFYSTICVALSDTGWFAGNGAKWGSDPREMDEAELIVMWGGNPVATQVNVMAHVAKARKARGAKLVVIDPYRTGTAEQADLHLCLKPGTDGALACAVMHVLFKEGFADREYMAAYARDADRLEAHLKSRTPEWAAAITGLKAEEIVAFARLYGATKRAFLRVGYGFSRSRNGAAQMFAVSCLPIVSGKWQHRGAGAMYGMTGIYGIDKTLIEGLDRQDKSIRSLDQSRMGPILTGDKAALGDGPPVTALFIQNTNPMVVCPEHLKVRDGFRRKDLFVCVHEQFLTDTAAMADIVLPATTFLEHDDIYQASGHTHLQVVKKVIEPIGESLSNHEVLQGLAKRLGAEHPGFEMTTWEIIEATLKASHLPDAETIYRMGWLDLAPSFRQAHFLDGFANEDKRFHFAPDWKRWGIDHARMPALPDHLDIIEKADDEHPFRLVTAPARQFLNTSFTETPGSMAREKRPTAMIHPRDCAKLGLVEDGLVRIGNKRGSVVVHVRPFDGLQQGVVVVESIFPNTAFREGAGINTLVGADPGPPKGGAVFHDTAVWLKQTN